MEKGRFPFILRVCHKKRRGQEVITVRVAHVGPELQILCQRGCRDLGLDRATGKERRPAPFGAAFGVGIDTAGNDTPAGFPGVCQLVIAIAFDHLAGFSIDSAFVLAGQVVPAAMAGVGGIGAVVGVEGRLFLYQLRIAGEVGTDVDAVLCPPHPIIFQSQLHAGDLIGLGVTDEPVVGVAAIVPLCHDANEVVDAGRVLCGFPGADEFGDPMRVEAFKLGDGGFGNEDAGSGDDEIVAAMDESRHAIHNKAVAGLRNDVGDDVPPLTTHVVRPVIMPDRDLAVGGIAARSDETAAIAGCFVIAGTGSFLIGQPGDVILGELDVSVQGDDVVDIEGFAFCLEFLRLSR